ncbi:3-oxoacyl-ACP reductase FabG [Paenibacillus hemerocallicola]|uniref:3-oxoacyl-ACP reductase FabG n=1 Tax=Paenibacillus hemerocallicola TaxID=1172614 RepID=A0A5C4SXW3_9BACL|nr:3-oxoacyl-ACP reductase family protein [Paenibacillus hemerocallicola]TNJ61206.1 3-oxoacyl-ACP reductase FabG [Paenibacillus hemerocallicola]
MRLKDKVALVTGGSTGIGREVCLAFAAEGARVAVNYIGPEEKAKEVVSAIEAAGGHAMAVFADVSDEGQVNAMVEAVGRAWGGVDILVNNAGIYPRKEWHEITGDEWDRVQAVNLKSCFLTSKAVFPHMKDKGYGKIINVSSVTFWRGQKGFVHYVASKGGVVGFTRALSREVGMHGITVNTISPGAVLTEQELLDMPDAAEREKTRLYLEEEQAIPRRQLPPDMVGAFLFLASSDSDFTTGQTVNVDGGWVMH